MKITRRQLKKIINESLNEMNKSEKSFRAAQNQYDNQQHPDYYAEPRPSDNATDDDIFDYAMDAYEELFEELVDTAVKEEVITREAAETMNPNELIKILKSSFKPDIYEDEYDEHITNQAEEEAGEAQADAEAARYDGDYY